MKLTLPERVFKRLTGSQMAVASAMANKARAQYWLSRARQEPRLRSVQVAFARAAHHAYLEDIIRIRRYRDALL